MNALLLLFMTYFGQPEDIKIHALLIGIGAYPFSEATRLEGPAQDVDMMRSFLERRFEKPNIRVLLDEAATYDGIEAELKRLAQMAGAQDEVWVYFSGHGSRTPDTNRDENSGWDSTWVTYGEAIDRGRSTRNKEYRRKDMSDDVLNYHFSKLPKKLVVISDSCHSGSVTRGAKIRGIAMAHKPPPSSPENWGRLGTRGIRLSACRDNEYAYENRTNEGSYGIFTHHLYQVLSKANSKNTWRDIFLEVQTKMMAADRGRQIPQLEGEGMVTLNFDKGDPWTQGVAVMSKKDRTLTLGAGTLSGIQKGSVFSNGRVWLEVTQTSLISATAKVTQGKMPKIGSLFSLVKVAPNNNQIPLFFVWGCRPKEVHHQELEDLFFHQYARYFRRAESKRAARWIIRSCRNLDLASSFPHFPTLSNPEMLSFVITNADDQPLLNGPLFSGHNVEELLKPDFEKALSRFIQRQNILDLDGPNTTSLNVAVTPVFYRKCKEEGPAPGADYLLDETGTPFEKISSSPTDFTFEQGTVAAFNIKNENHQDLYFYLVNCGPDGSCFNSYPKRIFNQEAALVKAGSTKHLRAEHAVRFNQPGFEFIRVVVSDTALDPYTFEIPALTGENRAQLGNPLSHFIHNDTRGTTFYKGEQQQWATQLFAWQIHAKGGE